MAVSVTGKPVLGAEHGHCRLGDGLVGEEIELETAAQHCVGQIGHGAGPSGSSIADDDIDPAEVGAAAIKGGTHRSRVGDIAAQAQSAGAAGGGHGGGALAIEVDHGQVGAGGGKGPSRRFADRPAAAGDQHYLTGQGLLGSLAQFGLLQAPVLHIKGVVLIDGPKAADALGRHQSGGPSFSDVGGDRGIGGGAAHTDQAMARQGQQARQGIKGGFTTADALVLAVEIGPVVGQISCQGSLHLGSPGEQGPGINGGPVGSGGGRGQHQGPGLGADHMVRGGHAPTGPVRQTGVIHDGAG